MNAAIFFDRDDTLIEDARYLDDPARLRLLPGVRDAMRRLDGAFRFFLFSNQSGIGRGYFSWQQADAVNRRLFDTLALPRPFDAVCMAWERPDQPPVYRKPSPRFIIECIHDFNLDPAQCWMVGNRLSDLRAGVRSGIHMALVHADPAGEDGLAEFVTRHHVPAFPGVPAFADYVLAWISHHERKSRP